MNKCIKNGWEWFKEHKKEIIIVGTTSIVSAIGGIVLYKNFGNTNMITNWKPPKLNITDNGIDGNLVRHHDGATEVFIYDNIPLAAMGELGKHLVTSIPDLPDKSNAIYLEMAISN